MYGGVSLNRYNKKVVRIITAHPSLKIFDVPWSEIICKVNIGDTSEFGLVGVRWGLNNGNSEGVHTHSLLLNAQYR